MEGLQQSIRDLQRRVDAIEHAAGADDSLVAGRRASGSEARILKKVSTRLQDFEAALAEQLSNMRSDFDKTLSHVNRGASSMRPVDAAGASADFATMAADLEKLKYDVGELKDPLSKNKGEVNRVRRIVLACERDIEDVTAAIDAVNMDLDAMKARMDGDIQESLKNHDSWMKDVSNTLQQMQNKEENLTEDIINLKNEMETNLVQSTMKITSDTDQAVKALNGRIDSTNNDLAATQVSLHTTKNSLGDCFNEVAVVQSGLEQNVAGTEARLKTDIRQKQQEAFDKVGAVGEHMRDVLKLREDVNGLTVKSASHEVDIQENSNAIRKMEKQMDTKVNEKLFKDLKHCTASLTNGVVKFAQVVGVFPGPKFGDSDGVGQSDADVELLGWEECAENMSLSIDKAWRQRHSQPFRNILDMIAKKADHGGLRLLQISQNQIESQLEHVKHERELWKEVEPRLQQQPLQLSLSMKEQTGDSMGTLPTVPMSARSLRR